MISGTTYQQLQMFHVIVEEGSISGAARRLEIAPPSVSHALKALETQLGLPLFTRTTRRLELTEAGTLLFERTFDQVNALSLAVESVQDLAAHPSGKVRITLPRFAFQQWLQPIYAEFCQQYPDIQLEISLSDAAIDIIRDGFDLGIRFGHKVSSGMVARRLTADCKEALFASPEYIARHGEPDSISALKTHKLIHYRFQASNQLAPLTLQVDDHEIAVEMTPALIVNDTDMMVDAALHSLGIGRVLAPIVAGHLHDGRLLPVLEQHWLTYPGLYIYFHQHSQKARRVRVLIDFLLEKMK